MELLEEFLVLKEFLFVLLGEGLNTEGQDGHVESVPVKLRDQLLDELLVELGVDDLGLVHLDDQWVVILSARLDIAHQHVLTNQSHFCM